MHQCEIVTVNYNNAGYSEALIKNIEHIRLSTLCDLGLTIVDNDSDENDYKKLIESSMGKDWVNIIRNSENLGYFKGLNVGIASVNVKRGVLVCNNDITFEQDFFTKLVTLNIEGNTLVLCPKVIAKGGRMQNPHCINRFSKLRLFTHDLYYSNYYLGTLLYRLSRVVKNIRGVEMAQSDVETRRAIHMGIGACYFLTSNFFKHYNKLDDSVFLWGEEALLAGQVVKVSGITFYEPSLVIHHAENVSVMKIPSKVAYNISKGSYKIYRKYL